MGFLMFICLCGFFYVYLFMGFLMFICLHGFFYVLNTWLRSSAFGWDFQIDFRMSLDEPLHARLEPTITASKRSKQGDWFR